MKNFSLLKNLVGIAIITIIFGIIYTTVQQTYRLGANDPQIQIARDVNKKLEQGKSIENFFTDTIDIAQSLSTFVALFDITGKPMRSSGFLDNKMVNLPTGIFDFTRSHAEHHVTWQPRNGVRLAMVIVTSNSSPVGFVASGRSLVVVEEREHNLVTMVLFGWIGCIALALLYAVLHFYKISRLSSEG